MSGALSKVSDIFLKVFFMKLLCIHIIIALAPSISKKNLENY